MKPAKAIAWTIAGLSAVSLLGSTYTLFERITAFNREHPRTMFYFQPISATTFEFNDIPVSVSEHADEGEHGRLLFEFGDEELALDIAIPKQFEQLNMQTLGLASHNDWLHVLRMIEGEPGKSFDQVFAEVEAAQRPDRLIIVTRTPRPQDNDGVLKQKGMMDPEFGKDSWGWGEVIRKQWVFDFYEFMPDGTFKRHETLRFPSSRYLDEPREGELRQGTWQYSAALYVMPTGSAPKYNFTEAALVHSGHSLAVAGVSVLFLLGSIAFALAPSRAERVPGSPATPDELAEAARDRA
jgi:hypothetical protein